MLNNLYFNEEGQGLVEYALIIGVITIFVVASLTIIGNRISKNIFEVIGNNLHEPAPL